MSFANLGKRLLCLVLCLAALAILTLPVMATEEEGTKATAYTTLVHYDPAYSSMVIGRFEDGAKLTVLSEYGDFYQVDCFDMTGYVAKSQLSERDDEYYVNCDPESTETATAEYVSVADSFAVRDAVMELADQQLGVPYCMGGTTPSGFDCSGFASYVMKNNGFTIRRTVSQQLQDTIIIPRECLQPGDLIFFREGSVFTSHVGIYAGDNQIIHAGNAGIGYADMDLYYFRTNYLCCRRIINVDTSASQQLPSVVSAPVAEGLRTA